MGAFAIIQLIVLIMGALPNLITSVEEMFSHAPGSGAKKKEAVLATVGVMIDASNAAASIAGEKGTLVSDELKTSILKAAGATTDTVVAAVNVVNGFGVKPNNAIQS